MIVEKWEYKFVDMRDPDNREWPKSTEELKNIFDKLGEDGWEFVEFYTHLDAFLKRRK